MLRFTHNLFKKCLFCWWSSLVLWLQLQSMWQMRNRLFSWALSSHMQLPLVFPSLRICTKPDSSSYPQPAPPPGILHVEKDVILPSRKMNITLDPSGSLTHNHSKSASHIDSASTRSAKSIHFSPSFLLLWLFRHHRSVLCPPVLPSTNPLATLQPERAF